MNQLFQGDNLAILRNMPDESVDLIYADPPFNTGRVLNGAYLPDEKGVESSYADKTDYDLPTKAWHKNHNEWLEENKDSEWYFLSHFCTPTNLYYFFDMIPVLEEIKRVLKKTGAMYWHINQRTAHTYRIIFDKVFGDIRCFRNQIIWHYPNKAHMPNLKTRFNNNYDTIFFYTKIHGRSGICIHELDLEYENESKKKMGCVWSIPYASQKERLGYPTQKPIRLLERIIKASSNQHDIVLDPFAGSGTTLDAAHTLGRHWIGIDVGDAAIETIQERMRNRHGLEYDRDYEIIRGT